MFLKEYRRLNIPSGDLRLSITNNCNMKCFYCHNEGQEYNAKHYISLSEVETIVSRALKYGIFKIRITGGEPLIHPEIKEILFMLKRKFPQLETGINTNGMETEKLESLCSDNILKRVVIGLDYFDAPISKISSTGVSSKEIRDMAIRIQNKGVKLEIASVLNNNEADLIHLIEWGLDNRIDIKILEKTEFPYNNNCTNDAFPNFMNSVSRRFNITKGVTVDLQEYFLTNNVSKIKFFQSHCNRNECDICSRLHMRVTCKGEAMPCLMRLDTKFDLLGEDFDKNMCRAIANLGNGPNRPIV